MHLVHTQAASMMASIGDIRAIELPKKLVLTTQEKDILRKAMEICEKAASLVEDSDDPGCFGVAEAWLGECLS